MAATTATILPQTPAPTGPASNATSGRRNPKSRNGCAACKSRKLKCGEERPDCKNCLKRGNQCPGYQKALKWSVKHEVFRSREPEPPKELALQPPRDVSNADSALPAAATAPQPAATLFCEQPSPGDRPAKRRRTESGILVPSSVVSDTCELPAPELDDVIELPRLPEDPYEDAETDIRPDPESSGSRALLRAFYRLPPAAPQAAMMDTGSYLINHYFQDVCTIFSAFDSTLNPFRMSIARLWGGSEPIYFAIQSMAAGHLANTYPQMAAVGIELQRKASSSLQNELQLALVGSAKPDRSLLTLLLLGLSACWHDPNDLGLNYLRAARSLMCNKLLQNNTPESKEQQRQDQFFEEALVYWEMMMGFVSPDAGKPADDIYASNINQQLPLPGPRSNPKVLPHPWTGVAPRAQILLAETGRLVREERLQQQLDFFDVDLLASQRRQELAESLEEQLLAIEPPDAEALVDVQDENTAKADFLVIAEATRCAALLDLYRIFPGLLAKRLGPSDVPQPTLAPSTGSSGTSDASFSPSTALSLNDSPFSFSFDAGQTEPGNTSAPTIAFLNSLATHVLTLIETLPSTSGTRFLQLMLIVMAGGELRFTNPNGINLDFFDPTSEDGKVAHARAFVEQRLSEHGLRLPAKPVRRMIEIVQEVWRRSDAGAEDVFWLDVVVERGWETVMG